MEAKQVRLLLFWCPSTSPSPSLSLSKCEYCFCQGTGLTQMP